VSRAISEPPARHLPAAPVLALVQALLDRVQGLCTLIAGIAVALAAAILTWEVIGRYFLKIASEWQDESATFLLLGATFLSAGWVQRRRGHVGIDALRHILPAGANRIRAVLADLATLAFCGFFCWKCWSLLLEAVAENQTSDSAWGPPLWIPYSTMAAGMTLLVIQVAVQILDRRPAP
jgi:TRAP-type C4-dicarboxylate transport system permease small subunit